VDVTVAAPSAADSEEYVAAVLASRKLHGGWLSPPDSADAFAGYLERAAREDHAGYLIRHRSCGGLVGYANISNIVRGALQSGYLGYGAFAGHEGRGLMTLGLRLVLEDAFGRLALHRVEANIQPANARSLAMARRLGFAREGFSPRYLFIDGAWRDHERWALLADPGTTSPADSPQPFGSALPACRAGIMSVANPGGGETGIPCPHHWEER
jgi:ribosomal-protein-alanine N-acetyltransferase